MPLHDDHAGSVAAPHTDAQLRLANACHPSLPGDVRRRILWGVARGARDARWLARLRHSDSATSALAMDMLDDYEARPPARSLLPVRGIAVWVLALLGAAVVVVACARRGGMGAASAAAALALGSAFLVLGVAGAAPPGRGGRRRRAPPPPAQEPFPVAARYRAAGGDPVTGDHFPRREKSDGEVDPPRR